MDEVFALFRPELTSLLQTDAWSQPTSLVTQLNLPDGDAMLTLRTAYSNSPDEPFFLLDFDYYEEGQLGFERLIERCDGIIVSSIMPSAGVCKSRVWPALATAYRQDMRLWH